MAGTQSVLLSSGEVAANICNMNGQQALKQPFRPRSYCTNATYELTSKAKDVDRISYDWQ